MISINTGEEKLHQLRLAEIMLCLRKSETRLTGRARSDREGEMHKLPYTEIVVGVLASLLSSAPALAAGNVQAGKALAEQWCTNCHIVDKNAPNAIESKPVGPDFATIRGIDAAKLKAQLRNPHPVMSNFPDLSDQQISDLVAYIASIAK
jgi:mono/diheme cytochrome c family protein